MSQPAPVFVTGMGVVCAGASNVNELRHLLAHPVVSFQPPTVFPIKHPSGALPVAEVGALPDEAADLPRTHRLARMAAREALGNGRRPDAIVIGTTTGGIATTEAALEAGTTSPEAYRWHGLDTVALCLAEAYGVDGPVMTLSTACSSATVALSVGAALLHMGYSSVLCGGVDSISRLTFHGFRQLQLVAATGCTPLDANRTGMTVGEGAGFLLLEKEPTHRPLLARLAGTGLSCDAYHATSPHPEGAGAALAMRQALAQAGIETRAIDYVNLHGTGTPDNDKAEAHAVRQVFGDAVPALSSTKGLTGHPLAAAGAIEAVIAVLALREGMLPANTGLVTLDSSLGLEPVRVPSPAAVSTVLSNSFGFGGNNACVVLEQVPSPRAPGPSTTERLALAPLRIAASACLTARGNLDDTWAALCAGQVVAGLVPDVAFAKAAPAAFVRRLKRLPRLMLALAHIAHTASGRTTPPETIAAGTAWGPLAETQEFLRKLFESGDQFSSPTDFIGSVHNAPAGQIALLLGCQSPNLTCSAGERSFCQALLCASLQIAKGAGSALLVAAEAFEPKLSPLFEPAIANSPLLSDGGAAFVLLPDDSTPGPRLDSPREFAWHGRAAEQLVDVAAEHHDAVLVGMPASPDATSAATLAHLSGRLPAGFVLPYRERLGQHASISATLAAVAARAVVEGALPLGDIPVPLSRKRLLVVELGARISLFTVSA